MRNLEDSKWPADLYSLHSSHHREYDFDFLQGLDVPRGARILDVGCGSGQFTRTLCKTIPDCVVVGLDASQQMIEFARQNNQHERVTYVHGRAEHLSVTVLKSSAFDAVVSKAALHWIPEDKHGQVLTNIGRVLRPNGLLRVEMGEKGQLRKTRRILDEESTRVGGTVSPWYFPTETEYQKRLEAHGFRMEQGWIRSIPQTRRFNDLSDLWGWLRSQILIAYEPTIQPRLVPQFRKRVLSRAETELRHSDGSYDQDYVRLDVLARLAVPIRSGSG